jgi:hypothetical protein
VLTETNVTEQEGRKVKVQGFHHPFAEEVVAVPWFVKLKLAPTFNTSFARDL